MTNSGGGLKLDQDKFKFSLLPWEPLMDVVRVMMFGEKKYAAHNWKKGIAVTRLIDAGMRHRTAFLLGDDNDPESGISHLAHSVCCDLFALWMIKFRPDMDDRYQAPEQTVNGMTINELRSKAKIVP